MLDGIRNRGLRKKAFDAFFISKMADALVSETSGEGRRRKLRKKTIKRSRLEKGAICLRNLGRKRILAYRSRSID